MVAVCSIFTQKAPARRPVSFVKNIVPPAIMPVLASRITQTLAWTGPRPCSKLAQPIQYAVHNHVSFLCSSACCGVGQRKLHRLDALRLYNVVRYLQAKEKEISTLSMIGMAAQEQNKAIDSLETASPPFKPCLACPQRFIRVGKKHFCLDDEQDKLPSSLGKFLRRFPDIFQFPDAVVGKPNDNASVLLAWQSVKVSPAQPLHPQSVQQRLSTRLASAWQSLSGRSSSEHLLSEPRERIPEQSLEPPSARSSSEHFLSEPHERIPEQPLELLRHTSSEKFSDAESPQLISDLEDLTAMIPTDVGERLISFDMRHAFAIACAGELHRTRPGDAYALTPLRTSMNAASVLRMLPSDLRDKLQTREKQGDMSDTAAHPNQDLGFSATIFQESFAKMSDEIAPEILLESVNDIVLDIGRPPYCWLRGKPGKPAKRVLLSHSVDRLVSADDLRHVQAHAGAFGPDNRATAHGELHRTSAMRTCGVRARGNGGGGGDGCGGSDGGGDDIGGVTIRIGRSVEGAADMMADVLFGSDKSVLLLGPPGSGKTTIIREMSRLLGIAHNVVVIDSSNEIGGAGVTPHSCIGLARRMMVPIHATQASVMLECVQNHTPHVMVLDEIGREKEAEAAEGAKRRGVRVIASAHGTLRDLINNRATSSLVGAWENVVVGDKSAKRATAKGLPSSKHVPQRMRPPIFDVVIELEAGVLDQWRLVTDAAAAVDAVLGGGQYDAQIRRRDPHTGAVFLAHVQA
mmetsp:Transcript_21138/g.41202  ORF Transcript_21138/g.41202 Transcript_21138/m.41202 type:complete len:745 (-) Transcript_21138:515-2749(-)